MNGHYVTNCELFPVLFLVAEPAIPVHLGLAFVLESIEHLALAIFDKFAYHGEEQDEDEGEELGDGLFRGEGHEVEDGDQGEVEVHRLFELFKEREGKPVQVSVVTRHNSVVHKSLALHAALEEAAEIYFVGEAIFFSCLFDFVIFGLASFDLDTFVR